MRIKLYIDPKAKGGPNLVGTTENGETVELVKTKLRISDQAVRIGTIEVGEEPRGPHGFSPAKDFVLRWFENHTRLDKRSTIRADHGGGALFLYRSEAKLLADAVGVVEMSAGMLGCELSDEFTTQLAALVDALMTLGPLTSGPKPRLDAPQDASQG